MAVSREMQEAAAATETSDVYLSRSVIGGVPIVMVTRLLLFFVYLGIPMMTAKFLGPAKYGQFSLCRTFSELTLIFAGLGLNTALVRFIPELQVQQNKRGLVRLLRKVFLSQVLGWLLFATVLLFTAPYLGKWLGIEPTWLILLASLIPAAQVMKNLVLDTFTAMFRVGTASSLSISQSVIWFILLLTVLRVLPRVEVALLILIVPTAALAVTGLFLLRRHVRRLQWQPTADHGIGRKRVLNIAVPSLINSSGSLILRQYSELFFIAVYFSPSVVGIYDLGCQLPGLVVNFVPLAIQQLFTSGFAEAHARDKDCLPRLIDSFYKALIVAVLPLAALGVALSPRIIELIYGDGMRAAGPLASAFFIYHSTFIISLPLSIALLIKEKVLHAQPLMILQVAVNLALDYALIPRYGIWGGFGAVACTWFITIPVRLYVIRRLVGGIYFPTMFFLRFLAVLLVMAGVCLPLSLHANAFGIASMAVLASLAYLLAIRFFRLIKPEDVADLRRMNFQALNRGLDILVPVRSA